MADALDAAAKAILSKASNSSERWFQLQDFIKKAAHTQAKGYNNESVLALVQRELTLGLLYPKIDSHVSAQVNHLLKCPFNVHHETGLLSLPLLDVRNFKIDQTPNIIDVLSNPSLMDPYLDAFDAFCARLVRK